ncbi:cleavage and polyadenylation specificity factor subunit 1-like [Argiope bruennichi]|uniref:cleavage and polyadenylation specificity factor subunit 1-like n=1 Tax=Argiope bruennichi TaxID=94029 RepID=UPI002494BA36|nr:cleavage and polyadenylation specificity factor subunit 1-like [Argiope bruennichi]XP_055950283.1 cleavage and polyadenylation specificity factor subunit 1-like [Argiope bruennichi]
MATNIYSFYKQMHPPTTVEHCLYCYFYNSWEQNLLVAGATVLRIYRLTPESEVPTSGEPKLKLECIQVFPLFGNIMSIKAVRLAGSPRDALLLSFKDAKLSLVEYDPSTHDLKTLSLHYFEEEDMKAGATHHPFVPEVRVDPDGRCAAMVVYERSIVILPFRKDTITEEPEIAVGSAHIPFGVKTPVLASYTIKFSDIDEKVNNVKDFQFLQGYYEPTLLLLHEPLRTWPGRTAVRHDTCAILALSLNLNQKVHPVIWTVTGLPFDCLYAMAVPKPIGGVLLVAVNSLLYLNQSVPPYGVSLNSFTYESTDFPLKQQDGIKLSLDCSSSAFISYDKLVISLKGGELYVLTLFNDGMRSVRGFNFDRAASSVITTCMCVCEEGYLFLGSRLGNSLLLRYTEKVDNAVQEVKIEENSIKQNSTEEQNGEANEESAAKKARLDNMDDWMATDVNLIEDPEELEVYGNLEQTTKLVTSYTFEVCDSLLNIGPCGRICMGEPAFLSEEFSGNADHDLELVTTSGYGKNGALSVLQRTIRPQVVTTFELPGCVDMWTVVGQLSDAENLEEKLPEAKEEITEENQNKQSLQNSHAFLILSRTDSSMILQTGQEINELDHSGFSTQAPTVFAGNIGNNRFIVQVSQMGVRLLQGSQQVQHIPLDVGSPIVWATVADPYVVIMSGEGLVIQLYLKADDFGTGARLHVSRPQLAQVKSRVSSLCVYKDISGLFNTSPRKEPEETSQVTNTIAPVINVADVLKINPDAIDDEDALLYGDVVTPVEKVVDEVKAPGKKPRQKIEVKEYPPTFWLFIVRENGILEIYSLPTYKLCYLVKNFPMGQKYLVDSGQATSTLPSASEKSSEKLHEALPIIHEILVVGLGIRNSRPMLLARAGEDLLIYEIFPFYEIEIENHLKLRFRKVNHELLTRERKLFKSKKNEEPESTPLCKRWLRYFVDISGYSGVFVCGANPYWLFLTAHGELRIHSMTIDGAVTCFAPFHNVNCPRGFLYFNKQGELRICVLPTHLNYDAPWPVRKVPLRCTPHFINYHPDTKTYCIVTSSLEACSKLVRFNGDEKEYEAIEKTDERYIFPMTEKFNMQLFSPVSWEVIPNTLMEFDEWEHVTNVKNVMLASEGTRSGLKGYIAVSTSYAYGEDVTSRGRIIILDIIDVVPEPGQPLTKNKMKTVYSKEQKGPVTAICQVSGFLLSAIGQKIYIWQLKDNDLIGVAFIDTHIYIHSAISIKNLIIVADIYKSISLLRYQENSRTLSLVSRDVQPLEAYGIEFLIDNAQAGFLVSDVEKNLVVFAYCPEARESFGGSRLLRKADMHLGYQVTSFFRICSRLGDLANYDKRQAAIVEKRHITMFATLDGGLGYILPISEKTYRRLLMLQNVLVVNIPHTAGLNPKAFRLYKSQRKLLQNPHKNILDGDLLTMFLNLSISEKNEVAKRIGTSSDQIHEDLLEIHQYTSYF